MFIDPEFRRLPSYEKNHPTQAAKVSVCRYEGRYIRVGKKDTKDTKDTKVTEVTEVTEDTEDTEDTEVERGRFAGRGSSSAGASKGPKDLRTIGPNNPNQPIPQ